MGLVSFMILLYWLINNLLRTLITSHIIIQNRVLEFLIFTLFLIDAAFKQAALTTLSATDTVHGSHSTLPRNIDTLGSYLGFDGWNLWYRRLGCVSLVCIHKKVRFFHLRLLDFRRVLIMNRLSLYLSHFNIFLLWLFHWSLRLQELDGSLVVRCKRFEVYLHIVK